MLRCATQGDGEDDAECTTFEEIDHKSHGDTGGPRSIHAKDREDNHANIRDKEDPSRFEEPLGKGGEETANSEHGVADRQILERTEVIAVNTLSELNRSEYIQLAGHILGLESAHEGLKVSREPFLATNITEL